MKKAVFLDRDGTVNKETGYLHKPDDFSFLPGVVEAIRIFRELGYMVIVVTNQSGVAHGYYEEEDVKRLHDHMDGLLALEGTSVDAYYYCPHHPEGARDDYRKICGCRKPAPGMIQQAAKVFDLDLARSICIGDKTIDAQAGMNAGVGRCALVKGIYPVDETIARSVPLFGNLLEFALHLKSVEQELNAQMASTD